MYKSAESKYNFAVWHVLNRIKKEMLFNSNKQRVVDYLLDVNVKREAPITLVEEQNVIQALLKDGIITLQDEPWETGTGKPQTLDYHPFLLHHFIVNDGFDDYYDKYQISQSLNSGVLRFDNNTFILQMRDGSIKTVSFDTQRGTRKMFVVFQVLVDHVKRSASPISKSEIVVKAKKDYGLEVTSRELHDIVSNIKKSKLKPAQLDEIIHFKYDRKTDGWLVEVTR